MSKAPLVSSVKDKKSQQTVNRDCARTNFFSDLDVLFQAAMLAENYAAALKAKELLGKARGYFTPQKKNSNQNLGSRKSN